MMLNPDASWKNLWGLINQNGWIFIGVIAALVAVAYAAKNWGPECARTEVREVEMIQHGKFGSRNVKHQYKVCADNTQPQGEH
jgi:hypothetical protein